MKATEVVEKLRQVFGEEVVSAPAEFRGETTVKVERAKIHDICHFAKTSLGFNLLLDISSVDHFGEEPRFEMVYELAQVDAPLHLRVKCAVSEDDPAVPTVSDLWPTANWHEREIFDMMGLHFEGHPDLRRILMWDGYPYFPLRKDFPLAGKDSDVSEVAFSAPAPLEGGPFVTSPSGDTAQHREPRAKQFLSE